MGNKMKVLFVDVDGVLNCATTTARTPDGFFFVDDELVARLKRVIDATGAVVVMSSDWRLGSVVTPKIPAHFNVAWDMLVKKLKEFGIEVFDVTPNLRWDIRGAECNKWATDNGVEKWIAVDDRPELFSNPDWVIETDERYGLTNEIAEEIIRRLE